MDNRKEEKQNARDFAANKSQRSASRTLTKHVVEAMASMKDAPLADDGLKKLEVRNVAIFSPLRRRLGDRIIRWH